MINVANFPKAYKEVFAILKKMDEEDKKKINEDFLNTLKENMDKNYVFEYIHDLKVEEQNILNETKAILAYIYVNYLADEEQKKLIMQKYRQDIKKDEENKKQKYKTEDMYTKNNENNEEVSMIEHKKENFFRKLFKRIFKNRKKKN